MVHLDSLFTATEHITVLTTAQRAGLVNYIALIHELPHALWTFYRQIEGNHTTTQGDTAGSASGGHGFAATQILSSLRAADGLL